jgi:hypothetical protein
MLSMTVLLNFYIIGTLDVNFLISADVSRFLLALYRYVDLDGLNLILVLKHFNVKFVKGIKLYLFFILAVWQNFQADFIKRIEALKPKYSKSEL